jgi:aspartyl-tRNA(Asn)/glutamyl-tRNA(Gln) amidotransferase subunit C
MTLTKKEVEHLANLARIELSEKEKEVFTQELSSILDYIKELQKVDTQGVEPLSQVTDLVNVKRKDEVSEDYAANEILDSAPYQENGQVKIKSVF